MNILELPIILRFNEHASVKDTEELRRLLGILKNNYNFDWHVDTYANCVIHAPKEEEQ